jgi:hypothetical protein
MLFRRWYISPTPSVEGANNASNSLAIADAFWLAVAKAGSCRSALSIARGLAYLKRQFMLEQVGQPSLSSFLIASELVSMLHNSSLDVVLQGASSFLRITHQSLGEGCWCSGPLRPCWCGLKCWGLLQHWCSRDGGGGHHRVAHPRERVCGATVTR